VNIDSAIIEIDADLEAVEQFVPELLVDLKEESMFAGMKTVDFRVLLELLRGVDFRLVTDEGQIHLFFHLQAIELVAKGGHLAGDAQAFIGILATGVKERQGQGPPFELLQGVSRAMLVCDAEVSREAGPSFVWGQPARSIGDLGAAGIGRAAFGAGPRFTRLESRATR